ncbi:Rhombotin-1 [Frankliniella fusca]|uniref:Rhombotin-1 n=1 Tax=Frankliniella fusca TaxID=407009 RepID=A0AAE1HQ38_9NEOP|nr:Rhombotin-1 [Frankliniella fusca]
MAVPYEGDGRASWVRQGRSGRPGAPVRSGPSLFAHCAPRSLLLIRRYLLKALDMLWHEDCLKCGCCDCRLGEVGSTLYTKANLLLCRRDYLRLFGNTGYCAACSKVIPGLRDGDAGQAQRVSPRVLRMFCVGDRFYLCENKILCEYDYEERMVFANMSQQQTSIPPIKRQPNNNNNSSVANNNTTNSNNNNTNHQQQQPQQTTVQCNVTLNEDHVGSSPAAPGQQPLHVHVQVSSGYHHQLLEPVGGRSK